MSSIPQLHRPKMAIEEPRPVDLWNTALAISETFVGVGSLFNPLYKVETKSSTLGKPKT